MLNYLASGISTGLSELPLIAINTVASLLLGLAVAGLYRFKNEYSHNLAMTLTLLPALVQIIIMLASGNIGVGVAVAGAFSLIRFRSVAGTSRDIAYLFFAMALGFVIGLGHLVYAFALLVIIGAASMLFTMLRFSGSEQEARTLRIRIPENLDYDGLFDDVFDKYTHTAELETVKTSQMGSLYELTYNVRLKSAAMPKEFIDDLRIRNGNLNIMLSRGRNTREEL